MEKERLENLLNELAERTAEPVRPSLAEDIKRRIPSHLATHRGGLDTIRIIIDLRVSKLAAAAVIIATMILCTTFFGGADSAGGGLYQDSKMLLTYFLKGSIGTNKHMLEQLQESSDFFQNGREVVYYGDSVKGKDKDALLMHWKISENRYRVICGDFRTEVVNAERLIKLQAEMLQKKSK